MDKDANSLYNSAIMKNYQTDLKLETCRKIPHYGWDGTYLAGR